jgi:hypothetical protein
MSMLASDFGIAEKAPTSSSAFCTPPGLRTGSSR